MAAGLRHARRLVGRDETGSLTLRRGRPDDRDDPSIALDAAGGDPQTWTRCSRMPTARHGWAAPGALENSRRRGANIAASATGLPAQRVMAITQSADGFLWLAVDRGPLYAGRRAALIRLHPSDFERAASRERAAHRLPDLRCRERPGRRAVGIGGRRAIDRRQPVVCHRRKPHGRGSGTVRARTGTRRGARAHRRRDHRRSHRGPGTHRRAAGRDAQGADRLHGAPPDVLRGRRGSATASMDSTATGSTPAGGARRTTRISRPGRYVFRVQASDDGGTWSAPEAQWSFTLQPAFRQTGWFYALCGVGVLLAAWGAAHTRGWILNRQFAATLAERTRLSREIHDTMLQSLVGHRAAGAGDRAAVRTARRRSSSRSSSRCAARSSSTSARPGRRSSTCARPCSRRAIWRRALAEIGRRTVESPTRVDVSAGADRRALARRRRRAAAHRPGGDHECRATRRRDAHSGGPAAGVGRRPLRVSDDGRGFDVDAMLSAATGHYGLDGHARASRARGRQPHRQELEQRDALWRRSCRAAANGRDARAPTTSRYPAHHRAVRRRSPHRPRGPAHDHQRRARHDRRRRRGDRWRGRGRVPAARARHHADGSAAAGHRRRGRDSRHPRDSIATRASSC